MEDTQLGSLHYNTPLGLYPFIPFPVSETLVLSQQHQRFEIEGCIDTPCKKFNKVLGGRGTASTVSQFVCLSMCLGFV